jgi:FAD/FMN-containing dehydrogenase
MNLSTSTRTLAYVTLDKDARQLSSSDVGAFAARIGGGVITATDDAYDQARKVWNATVDRRPALIARCLSEHDVQTAVRFAAAHRMLLSVRGGGHHIAGNAVAEGGLMIDLSGLRATRRAAPDSAARRRSDPPPGCARHRPHATQETRQAAARHATAIGAA